MNDVVVAIRPRAMGDVVLATPAFRSLALGAPDADLHVVTDARFAPLVEGLPWVKHVWRIERTNVSTRDIVAGLRRRRVRTAVDFFGNIRSAVIARASGARSVFGYELRGRKHLYTTTVPREIRFGEDHREHASAVHVRLALAAGGATTTLTPELAVNESSVLEARRLLATAGVTEPSNTVGLVAAGSWTTKMWPLSHSAVLARRLMSAGFVVLILAGPGEEQVTARLEGMVPGVRVLPSCDVAELAAVIRALRAVVGTDSGPRHLAAAWGVPSFAWFGPTHPDTWNPPGAIHGYWRTALPCRSCDRTACPHWNCLPGLSPQEGARLVMDHLDRHGR
ncbi:MAG: glycosyltransferase family 9 protein [Candidatus Eisenbacteria bacterium]